tara:strand:+ start:3972 stop:4085 length:114 start_codon:yes stop_codon:yes gene_type:complete
MEVKYKRIELVKIEEQPNPIKGHDIKFTVKIDTNHDI